MVACSGARSLCARRLKACVSAAPAQQRICAVILHAVTRIRSTKIAELSFIPLVTQGQSLLPCLSNHVLSSRILCGSMLSRTSSGNHCRSDPVQVQSTARIAIILEPICDGGRTCVSEVAQIAKRKKYAATKRTTRDACW